MLQDDRCGTVWGFHREHYCIQPLDHEGFPVHFCECDAELDMDPADRLPVLRWSDAEYALIRDGRLTVAESLALGEGKDEWLREHR